MRIVRIMIAVLVAGMAAGIVQAQSARSPESRMHLLFSSSPSVNSPQAPSGEILGEIDDPHNGDRWLLLRDESHPAGPGRLVLASAAGSGDTPKQTGRGTDAPPPVIHAGDHIVLEEHSAIVDARLESIAIEPAWPGSVFSARLTLGGRIVRARAAGPGRAILVEVAGGEGPGQ